MDFSIPFFTTPMGAFIVYGLCIAVFTYVLDNVQRGRRIKRAGLLRGESLAHEETPQAKEGA